MPSLAVTLAAYPFLPPGQGALILVFGGLGMLCMSLVLAILSGQVRERPNHHPGPPPSGTPAQWAHAVVKGAHEAGLRRMRVLRADSSGCMVQVASCGTCRRRRKGRAGRAGCEVERAHLEATARRLSRAAMARETACGVRGRAACTFEVVRA